MDYKTQGKKNKAAGTRFENRARTILERGGWTVAKWTNNVEFSKENEAFPINQISDNMGKLVKAKPKFSFNPALKRRLPVGMGSGFPDFICFRHNGFNGAREGYEIMFVEVKMNGYLDPEEKKKVEWYKRMFSHARFRVATKGEKRGEIILQEV